MTDLPGMWEESDLINGEADMTDTQETMREEQRQTNARVHGCAFNGWQCFHCGEIFETVGAARTHFGTTPDAIPGCMIKVSVGAERGLLMKLRETEDLLAENTRAQLDEDTALHRELHKMQSRHSDALRNAEELGYERGLKAATAQSAEKIARLEAEKSEQDNLYNKLCFRNEELHKQLAAAELSNKQLREALEKVLPFVVTQVVACGGLKCREAVCESCSGDAEQSAQIACDRYADATKALAQQPSTEALDAYVAKLIPPGWKVVPCRPTDAMRDAGNEEVLNRSDLFRAWDAMLKAAPTTITKKQKSTMKARKNAPFAGNGK